MIPSIHVIDRDDFKGFLNTFPRSVTRNLGEHFFDLGKELRNNVIRAMQNTARSVPRRYKRTKSGLFHHPSAPGFPPAVDSGNYVKGINVQRFHRGAEVFTYDVPYWEFLEYGTAKMEARPVWEKEIDDLDVLGEITRAVEKSL